MRLILFILFFCLNIFPQDGMIKSFYPNGNIKSEINFKDSIREGEAKFYSENGNITEERNYVNGRVEGLVKLYSEAGKLKEVYVIEDGRREGPTSLFDESGNYLTDIYFESGKLVVQPIVEEPFVSSNTQTDKNAADDKTEDAVTKPKFVKPKKVSNELLLPPEIEEEKFENDPAFFSTAEVMPEPVGGNEAIYKKLIYPSEAKNNEVEGTVKVKAFIDEYGEVTDVQILEGIGFGCDDIAKNAVYFAKFKPGLQKGKPVRVMLTLSIKFNPEMNQK